MSGEIRIQAAERRAVDGFYPARRTVFYRRSHFGLLFGRKAQCKPQT